MCCFPRSALGLALALLTACGPEQQSAEPERRPSWCPPEWDKCYTSFLPAIFKDHPFRPKGFGVGGALSRDQHDFWYYNWGYKGDYSEKRFLPMIWGGPRQPSCDPNHADYDPDADCTCNWNTWNGYGTQCHPGCANSPSAYAPDHTPGCTPAQRASFAQTYVDYILQDPRRKGRNWLIYNEPENLDQAALDPVEAARLFNVLYDQVHAADPKARFYCCGAMVFDDTRRQWMADFAAHVRRPLDGIHYHNYYAPQWTNADKIIQTMQDYYDFMQGVSTASGQQLGQLDMLITEWSGLFPTAAANRCAGANNRDTVMRPVAQWLNRHADEVNIVGAAWFGAGFSDWGSVSLFDAQTGDPTCLADEYFTYRWGAVP